jgi:aryl-alcohol dehydrogenase-like predicted oxidoreductase
VRYRTLGRTGWEISEIGCGLWGMGNWSDEVVDQLTVELGYAIESGCNFFDAAYAYGNGFSEKLLGRLLKKHADKTLYMATKIPPKNFKWPSQQHNTLEDVFPRDHVFEYTEKSLKSMDVRTIDLMQFHVWEDEWAHNRDWQKMVEELKAQNLVKAIGISLNVFEPNNGVQAVRTGLVDTVQVYYNIWEQSPEDRLFQVCHEMNVGILARCPFDYGFLTGKITRETIYPEGDWRKKYFVPENFSPSVEHADRLRPLVPAGMTMAEMALRFILYNRIVSTVIPGMRTGEHIKSNISCSDGKVLPVDVDERNGSHRVARVGHRHACARD